MADITMPALGIDDAAISYVLIAVTAGFPLVLIISWFVEISADGPRITASISQDERVPFQVDSFGEKDNDCMWELYPDDTIKFMSRVTKPWIGFKVLAAGAIPPKEGFRFAFENGADFIAPGMFDWQVSGNVKIAREVLADLAVKERARPWA